MAKTNVNATVHREETNPKCGIVMPISGAGEYTDAHWSDVLDILTEAVEAAGLEANIVSNADDVGIIQKRIVQNLYDNPVVVCDVSGKNPNVMFELGMRLAFDKATIIVKDDKTSYTFDTSPIEHLEYPRDLRFAKIVEFKKKLADKIQATRQKSLDDPNFSTFLKHFGEFTVAKIDQKEVSSQEFILDELRSIRQSVSRLERPQSFRRSGNGIRYTLPIGEGPVDICLRQQSEDQTNELIDRLGALSYIDRVVKRQQADHDHLEVTLLPDTLVHRERLDKVLANKNLSYRGSIDNVH